VSQTAKKTVPVSKVTTAEEFKIHQSHQNQKKLVV